MNTIILVVFVLNAVTLVAFVLLQQGKGADAGAAFGSGASATVFGARGSANFLSRTTAGLATLFFLLAMVLAYLSQGVQAPQSLAERALIERPAGDDATEVLPQRVPPPAEEEDGAAEEEGDPDAG